MYTLLGQNLLLCLDAEFWNSMAQENLRRVLQKQWNTNIAKNVILFLGDGMGISTVTAARIYKGQQQNKTGEEARLAFEEFPEIGLVKVEWLWESIGESTDCKTNSLHASLNN